jgi:molecular chaperone GrpE
MSEPPPPAVAGDAAGGRAEPLTPERIEAALADFRAWLTDAARGAEPPAEDAGDKAPDLFTLLGQLTALRHEVNLQTRAVRTQQEQNAETLTQMSRALDALRQAQAGAAQNQQRDRDAVLRPLLTTLVELHDALSVAAREVQRVQESVPPAPPISEADPVPPPPEMPPLPPRPPAWLRWLGVGGLDLPALDAFGKRYEAWRGQEMASAEERTRQARGTSNRAARLTAALVTGYTMSLQRLERALRQHGLEPVPAVGEPFDPERMEAVEAVTGTGEPAGRVLDEVRRGYLYNGRVFRFAHVRVAKG